MKSTGIVRNTDPLGRITLPIELRRILDIETKAGVEIFTEDNRIIMRKYRPNCVFCGKEKELEQFKGKRICKECMLGASYFTRIIG